MNFRHWLFAVAVAVAGVGASLPAAAQISGTKHNLGSGGSGPNKTAATTEICVFCHTPHGADTSAAVPLWNRSLASPPTYTSYASLNTSTLDGGTATVGSVSIACLSCHDGIQSMSSVINAPGSGTAWASAPTWTGSDKVTGIAKIGPDLSNDHPIGIQYGGGGLNGTTPTGVANLNDKDFKDPKSAVINSNRVWWVDTAIGTADTREKTDMILYSRTGALTAGVTEPFVECASCHDPHTTNDTFLRIQNTSSAVCLACHTK